ncbi:uncharacterized protein PFL1_04904 [Pseudozyma flocculosa PF-1]|uniref:C2H2-type domain-containing protein n=2 Tax=Pseudozyma flocculosa TaxID=84751 RepID=A0A5C3EWI3_9BASI|nr:uncharacterized protein PFL1_04904 [Pseudozyma flocculosa PF-1]EPQ27365.1 hypothetical protein PFL1_04904 [Pseudozyma flocculosa PF-1]SPO36220.1 uncharacterized protein PSFLO_01691 [Pseudozyma flocculosa]
MDEQYFSSPHDGSSFDLGGSGCAPMGFSPSIDANGGLPFTLSNGLETPSSFLMELQRKRADTVTTLKPDFEISTPLEVDEDGIEIDIPVRKRALQRLSLTSSIASSAPSTGTSDLDGYDPTGFESESDAQSSSSPTGEGAVGAARWGFNAAPSLADLSVAFAATTDRTPDLVHWRSNTTMQASYYQRNVRSPSASSAHGYDAFDNLGHSTDFSFAEFIDEDAKSTSQDDETKIQEAVDGAQALSLASSGSSVGRPSLVAAESSDSVFSFASTSALSAAGPSTPVKQSMPLPFYGQIPNHAVNSPHSPALHLLAADQSPTTVCGVTEPHTCSQACQLPSDMGGQHAAPTAAAAYAAQHRAALPPHLGQAAMGSPFHSPVAAADPHQWPVPRPLHLHDIGVATHGYPTQAMSFSQSAPSHVAQNPEMFGAGLMASPVPSSPAFSARSSSPYPTPVRPMYPSALLQQHQPQPHPHPLGLGVAGPSSQAASEGPDSPMTKAQQLVQHLWNPYAGLITKRSRGRRVPSKPEEMNNLGKSGKVYTCKVPGCGKCFKRSEHLKRHVRSIHTDDKPFVCSYPNCQKRFSRHDNLNQHARVHSSTASGGPAREGPGPMSQINEDGSAATTTASSSAYAGYGIEMQDANLAMQREGYFSFDSGAAPGHADGRMPTAAPSIGIDGYPAGLGEHQ